MVDRIGAPPRNVRAKGMVHKQVADVAKGMAEATWEEFATRSNQFYHYWPDKDVFVASRWHSFIQDARIALTELLHESRWSLTTPEEREQIHRALELNAAANPAINQAFRPKETFQ